MAAGESAANRAAMATAAQQVESAVTVIRGLQSTMNGYNSQLAAGWQGQAATAFAGTYEAFSADFAKVLNALQGIQEKLVSTRSTYETTEETNTAQVNRVMNALGG
jgi:WXG100 family type VII secretion target